MIKSTFFPKSPAQGIIAILEESVYLNFTIVWRNMMQGKHRAIVSIVAASFQEIAHL